MYSGINYFIMLYITSLIVIHLITASLYFFDYLHLIPLSPPPASDLYLYESAYFWSIINLQHYVSS